MKTLAIVCQKGGVGKTTIALGIGTKLVQEGKKVLFIDADAQCNLSGVFYVDTEGTTLYQVLNNPKNIKAAIIKTDRGDVVSGSPELATYKKSNTALKEALEIIDKDYDYCIIDCPPALGTMSVNALYSANACIIPVVLDYFSLQGAETTIDTIYQVKQKKPNISVLGLVINLYRANTRLGATMEELLKEKAKEKGVKVFNTKIRTCTKLKEAELVNEPSIYEYSKSSNAAKDFAELVKEIKERL